MTGLLIKKYHVAIYEENTHLVKRITDALKSWYDNRIVIESYNNPTHMFQAVNMCRAKNKPFDLAIFGSNEYFKSKQMVLKHTCPNLPIVMFKDEEKLQKETSKFLL
jgi:hypothetical protein